ncbi:MAG: helix-turn-helix domain-containing protein [Actinomycetota bacterium]
MKKHNAGEGQEHVESGNSMQFSFEDAAEAKGFTMAHNVLLRDAELSMQTRMAYLVLRSYAWQAGSTFVSQETVAGDLGCSVRQLQRYIAELVAFGLLRVQDRRRENQTNVYRFTSLSARYAVTGDRRDGDHTSPVSGAHTSPMAHKEDSVDEDSENTSPRTPVSEDDDVSLESEPAPKGETPNNPSLVPVASEGAVARWCGLRSELLTTECGWPPNKAGPAHKELLQARRMMFDDGRSPVEAEDVLRWALTHDFWSGRVQGVSAFRRSYDTLRQQMRSSSTTGGVYRNPPPEAYLEGLA